MVTVNMLIAASESAVYTDKHGWVVWIIGTRVINGCYEVEFNKDKTEITICQTGNAFPVERLYYVPRDKREDEYNEVIQDALDGKFQHVTLESSLPEKFILGRIAFEAFATVPWHELSSQQQASWERVAQSVKAHVIHQFDEDMPF